MVEVLYCDNHLLVLNKPAGMLTQPNDTDEESLESWGKKYLKERFQKRGNVFLEAVHRLDRPVSGIVLFARTSKALSRLNRAQREGQFEKKYLARVEGKPPLEGEYIDFLKHDSFHAACDPDGKKCHLRFKKLESGFVEITLLTGRYHQIRAQFALHGHPIIGDRKYGSKTVSKRVMLHHAELSFPHPISGVRQTVLAGHGC